MTLSIPWAQLDEWKENLFAVVGSVPATWQVLCEVNDYSLGPSGKKEMSFSSRCAVSLKSALNETNHCEHFWTPCLKGDPKMYRVSKEGRPNCSASEAEFLCCGDWMRN